MGAQSDLEKRGIKRKREIDRGRDGGREGKREDE